MTKPFGILVACVAVLLIGPTTTAQADTATNLPFTTGAPWIAVDPSGGHVFVSGGPGNSSIVVLNYAGKIVKTITGEGGASQMSLDAATHTLYVALHDATAISEINTQTLTETKRFSTAPYPAPTSLVIAGGKLWFSCAEGSSGCLVSADLDGTDMTTPIAGPFAPLFLAAGGSNNHLLAFGDSEDSPPELYVYDVSTSTPASVAYAFDPNDDSSDVADMTFDPSGSNLLLASGSPYFIQSLTSTTLLSSAQYPTGPYPISVAVTADGRFVAGGININSGPDVFVYPVGNTTPIRTFQVGDDNLTGLSHSLAFSPDASKLFAVTKSSATGHLTFHVIDQPTVTLKPSTTSLKSSTRTVRYGGRTSLTVGIKGPTTGTVDLYATTSSETHQLVATATVESGAATFAVKPTESTTYVAQLEEGAGWASSASGEVRVAVAPIVSVKVSADGTIRLRGHRVSKTRLTGRVTPKQPVDTPLRYVIQRRMGGRWRGDISQEFPVSDDGLAHVYFFTTRPGLFRVRLTYFGEPTYARASSAWKHFVVHPFH